MEFDLVAQVHNTPLGISLIIAEDDDGRTWVQIATAMGWDFASCSDGRTWEDADFYEPQGELAEWLTWQVEELV